jgi:hypothetical protein
VTAHDFTTWPVGTRKRRPAGVIAECPKCGRPGLLRVYAASPGRYELGWWHTTDATGLWARQQCRLSAATRTGVPAQLHPALDAFRDAGAKTEAGRLLDAHRRKQRQERKAKTKATPAPQRRRGKLHAQDLSGAGLVLCGSPKGEVVDDTAVTCDRCRRKMKRDIFRIGKAGT